ncbi:hypothetical protein [Agaribacter marinus]|uniref:Uncharacterized protein n=1 Tax=Agaribacter marinus TaxID=1431249 RepID=A0AA37T2J4_9ALTE|nr:hypothetical protein [Agaribacter marinus]GLR71108.1 hypothetical protein GCM10007852_20160 [Agaribacter marinus]
MKSKIFPILRQWVVVRKPNNVVKICNFANNYYGDQQCFVAKTDNIKDA